MRQAGSLGVAENRVVQGKGGVGVIIVASTTPDIPDKEKDGRGLGEVDLARQSIPQESRNGVENGPLLFKDGGQDIKRVALADLNRELHHQSALAVRAAAEGDGPNVGHGLDNGLDDGSDGRELLAAAPGDAEDAAVVLLVDLAILSTPLKSRKLTPQHRLGSAFTRPRSALQTMLGGSNKRHD